MSAIIGEFKSVDDGTFDVEASQMRDEIRIGEHILTTDEAWTLYLLLKAALEYNGVKAP